MLRVKYKGSFKTAGAGDCPSVFSEIVTLRNTLLSANKRILYT